MFRKNPDVARTAVATGASGIGSRSFFWLLAAAVATAVLWQIPGGAYVLYPFTILATWFHEMAHGLTALLMGGSFTKLVIYSDGSGAAFYSGPLLFGRIGRAIVAAGGPLGPPIAGAALILASRGKKAGATALTILGAAMLVTTALWIRSPFGVLAIPLMAAGILYVAFRGSPNAKAFAVQFLGVQACVSSFRQVSYLFTYSAGPLGISDTGQMQQALFAPYWVWGGLIALISVAILVFSLRAATS